MAGQRGPNCQSAEVGRAPRCHPRRLSGTIPTTLAEPRGPWGLRFDMDAHSVPAAGGVGADASGAASDDPPAAAVEFGPRAEAAEHAEVVDQEERDLDGRTEDGWMQEGWAWVDVGGCG